MRRTKAAGEKILAVLGPAVVHTGGGEIVIQLHPGDCQALERQVTQLAAATHPTATVRLAADESITAGGCRVVTEFGNVDMQLEAQLERIQQELS